MTNLLMQSGVRNNINKGRAELAVCLRLLSNEEKDGERKRKRVNSWADQKQNASMRHY